MHEGALKTDLIEYFICAFTWGIRDHERFEQFWASIYTPREAQQSLLSRFSNDGRVLGLAVYETVFAKSSCQVSYNAYGTVDSFVDRYIGHTLENAGSLPTAKEVSAFARESVAVEKDPFQE